MRGSVRGLPGSRVVGSVSEGSLSARIELNGTDIWHLEPLGRFGAAADASTHVLYHDGDLLPVQSACGTVPQPSALENFQAFADEGGVAGTSLKIVDIAFDSDFEFFQANGSSVANTVRDIEDILNRVALLYEDQLGVTFELTTILVRTAEPDPYSATNHEMLLTQFRSEWNTNRTGIYRDVAHLMTGKNIDGIIIGSTFTGTVCQTCGQARGYGFSQSRFSPSMAMRTCLTAHEIGHSLGADHCDGDSDCDVMCSMLGACAGSCTQFGSRSRASIAAAVAAANCLTTLASPLDPPFCDTFDSIVKSTMWPFNAVGTVSSSSSKPPSFPGALLLDTCCTGCGNAPDEIRSNFIRLGDSTQAMLIYFTQHTGAAATAGSQLFVEYWSNDGTWVELNTIVSNGTNQSSFTRWSHPLPEDAFHDEFRIRFRLERLSNQASWYIDDVSVVDVELTEPVLYVRADAPANGDGKSWRTAYRDLQDALNMAACARSVVEQIWVTRGTYRPDRGSGDRAATFRLVTGVALLGGFNGTETASEQRDPSANSTILSGDVGIPGTSNDNSFHVVTASLTEPGTVLDGFTITAGVANGSAPDDMGAGILNISGVPTIRNCTLSGNLARLGGAIHNTAGAAPTISDCLFRQNTAGSAGGSIHNAVGSIVVLRRCRFLRNTAAAAGGAIFTSAGELTATDCLFSGNTAMSGGALQNFSSAATLTNCTLSRNSASGSGGGIVNISSSNTLLNCVLWGNSDLGGTDESAQVHGQEPMVDYTCLQGFTGTFGGTGNSAGDPLFVDADGPDNLAGTLDDDPRLGTASPAIDAGEPSFLPEDGAKDLDGHPRVLCGGIDMGAYESAIGDENCDHDVNLADFASWTDCLTGPGGSQPSGCHAFDFNSDADIDLRDFSDFQKTFELVD